jgi:hypothetical protein
MEGISHEGLRIEIVASDSLTDCHPKIDIEPQPGNPYASIFLVRRSQIRVVMSVAVGVPRVQSRLTGRAHCWQSFERGKLSGRVIQRWQLRKGGEMVFRNEASGKEHATWSETQKPRRLRSALRLQRRKKPEPWRAAAQQHR